MPNKKEFVKPHRVSAVLEDKVVQRLQALADRKGVSLSKFISKVLTQLVLRPAR